MKVIGFNQLGKKKKISKVKIYCVGNVFKVTFCILAFAIFLLVGNLAINNFFANIHASLERFVNSFVDLIV